MRENRAPVMSRACVPDMRGERVRYPSPPKHRESTRTMTNDSPLPNHLTAVDERKACKVMVVKVIQFDARVDPVLARMDPVLARVNPVFSVKETQDTWLREKKVFSRLLRFD